MRSFLVRRALTAALTLLLLSALVFLILALAPGDAALVGASIDATPQEIAALRTRMGLDQPPVVRYFIWLRNAVTGDLGVSLRYGLNVTDLLAPRIPVTLFLGLASIAVSLAVGMFLGIVAAVFHQKSFDYGILVFSQIGLAVPNFWVGILLVYFLGVRLGWLSLNYTPPSSWEMLPAALLYLTFPVIALSTSRIAVFTRMTRASMLDTIAEQYVRTARSKGLPESVVIVRHALRPALVPVLTVAGVQLSALLGGTLIIEQVFAVPGVGRLVIESILARDGPVLQASAMFIGVSVIVVNFLVDLLYARLDPRIRYG